MKIKLKIASEEIKEIAFTVCNYDNNNLTSGLRPKYKKVISCTMQGVKRKVLNSMLNSDGSTKKKGITFMPIEAFYLENMLRDIIKDSSIKNDYTKNTLLKTANELDQKLISLTS